MAAVEGALTSVWTAIMGRVNSWTGEAQKREKRVEGLVTSIQSTFSALDFTQMTGYRVSVGFAGDVEGVNHEVASGVSKEDAEGALIEKLKVVFAKAVATGAEVNVKVLVAGNNVEVGTLHTMNGNGDIETSSMGRSSLDVTTLQNYFPSAHAMHIQAKHQAELDAKRAEASALQRQLDSLRATVGGDEANKLLELQATIDGFASAQALLLPALVEGKVDALLSDYNAGPLAKLQALDGSIDGTGGMVLDISTLRSSLEDLRTHVEALGIKHNASGEDVDTAVAMSADVKQALVRLGTQASLNEEVLTELGVTPENGIDDRFEELKQSDKTKLKDALQATDETDEALATALAAFKVKLEETQSEKDQLEAQESARVEELKSKLGLAAAAEQSQIDTKVAAIKSALSAAAPLWEKLNVTSLDEIDGAIEGLKAEFEAFKLKLRVLGLGLHQFDKGTISAAVETKLRDPSALVDNIQALVSAFDIDQSQLSSESITAHILRLQSLITELESAVRDRNVSLDQAQQDVANLESQKASLTLDLNKFLDVLAPQGHAPVSSHRGPPSPSGVAVPPPAAPVGRPSLDALVGIAVDRLGELQQAENTLTRLTDQLNTMYPAAVSATGAGTVSSDAPPAAGAASTELLGRIQKEHAAYLAVLAALGGTTGDRIEDPAATVSNLAARAKVLDNISAAVRGSTPTATGLADRDIQERVQLLMTGVGSVLALTGMSRARTIQDALGDGLQGFVPAART